MKPITPEELGLVNEFRDDESEKQSLINHINSYISSKKHDKEWVIGSYGNFTPKSNWISLANEVLDLFRANGWTITDQRIFFSFQTRVEFLIYKTP